MVHHCAKAREIVRAQQIVHMLAGKSGFGLVLGYKAVAEVPWGAQLSDPSTGQPV